MSRPATRLFVEAELAAGAAVRLDEDRAHFLRNVLRLEVGAIVAAFNATHGEWLARIDTIAKGHAVLVLHEQSRPPRPEPDLWLLFAPIKRGRIDQIAEKATELGVSVLQPVFTHRTDAQRVNTERLRANAVEAAEQCERLGVPEVREPKALAALLNDWPAERPLVVCAEAGATRPIVEAARQHAGRPAAFLIGPEGGFADFELADLARHPAAVMVGLGPRILRAETAALAALACWQAVAGDWMQSGLDKRPRSSL